MNNERAAMPDFAEILERDLRTEATRLAGTSPRRSLLRPRAALAGGLMVGAVAAAVFGASLWSGPAPAYAGPLIVTATAVDAPHVAREMERGLTAQYMFGPDVHFDQVREIDTPGGRAYVAGGAHGWCISVPDAASPNPARERGVACAKQADFERIGLSVSVGGQYVAAIAQGVREPTLRRAGQQQSESLHPSRFGVVSLGVKTGDTVTLYDTTGRARADRIHGA